MNKTPRVKDTNLNLKDQDQSKEIGKRNKNLIMDTLLKNKGKYNISKWYTKAKKMNALVSCFQNHTLYTSNK